VQRPNSRVSIRDASCLYEVELRDGAPRRATRTSGDGEFASGTGVLGEMLGIGAGRFVVAPATPGNIAGDLEGTLGEQAVVPEYALGEYPSKLTPTQASAIWRQYLTAYGALMHYGGVKAGDFVAIPAASSSVGLAAIQIVRDAGATSIALTRTSAKRAELIALGANHVVATDEEDYPARAHEITGGQGVRLTLDPVAGAFVEKLADAAAPGGIIIEYGTLSLAPTPFPLFSALGKGLSMRGYLLMEISQNPSLLAIAKKYVFDRLANGRFAPKIARTFSFEETVDAYRFLESNQQVGKVVVTVP